MHNEEIQSYRNKSEDLKQYFNNIDENNRIIEIASLLSARIFITKDKMYIFTDSGAMSDEDIEELKTKLKETLDNKFEKLAVYQYPKKANMDMKEFIELGNRHLRGNKIIETNKLFTLKGNANYNLLNTSDVSNDEKNDEDIAHQLDSELKNVVKKKISTEKKIEKIRTGKANIDEIITIFYTEKEKQVLNKIKKFLEKNKQKSINVSFEYKDSNRSLRRQRQHELRNAQKEIIKEVIPEKENKSTNNIDNKNSKKEKNANIDKVKELVYNILKGLNSNFRIDVHEFNENYLVNVDSDPMYKEAISEKSETILSILQSQLKDGYKAIELSVNNETIDKIINDSNDNIKEQSNNNIGKTPNSESIAKNQTMNNDELNKIKKTIYDFLKTPYIGIKDDIKIDIDKDKYTINIITNDVYENIVLNNLDIINKIIENQLIDDGNFEVLFNNNLLVDDNEKLNNNNSINKENLQNNQTESENKSKEKRDNVLTKEKENSNNINNITDPFANNDITDLDNDLVSDEFDMTKNNDELLQLQNQLRNTFNDKELILDLENKNDNIVITITSENSGKAQKAFDKLNGYSDKLKEKIKKQFPSIKFNNIVIKTNIIKNEVERRKIAIKQEFDTLAKEMLSINKDAFDIDYTFKCNYSNGILKFGFNLAVDIAENDQLDINEVKRLKDIIKENHPDANRVYINIVTKEDLANNMKNKENIKEGITLNKLEIPASEVANVIDENDVKLMIGKDFSVNDTAVKDLSDVDFITPVKKRKTPYKTYLFSFVSLTDERDAASNFTAKSGKVWSKMKFLALDDAKQTPFIVSIFGQYTDDQIKELNSIKEGDKLAAVGKIDYNDYEGSNFLSVSSLKLLAKNKVIDNTKATNRYELNAHTKMSKLAAINEPKKLIDMSVNDGLGGLAFTDDVSVQSYPALIGSQNKYNSFKPIFGTELNVITDKPTFVYNANNIDFTDKNTTYVAFDIETTGFSNKYDDIIELSMVKYKPTKVTDKNGNTSYELEEIDHERQLVKANKPIPAKIQELTQITQQDLDINGKSIQDALQSFLDFIGSKDNTILIGHNVIFDLDFINYKLDKYGFNKQIDNEVLDTLTVARRFLPNKRAYNLTTLTTTLKIKLTQAHTAVFDAQATGFVWMSLYNLINSDEHDIGKINNGLDLQKHELNKEHAYQEGFATPFSVLAKNQKGIKEIYRMISVSSTEHFFKKAKLYPDEIEANHSNVLIGSGGYDSKFWQYAYQKSYDKAKQYAKQMNFDYLEVSPFQNYALPKDDFDNYKETINNIIKIGNELNIPVVAVSDSHQYTNNKFDNMSYNVLKNKDNEIDENELHYTPLYTTKQMLEEFSFLPENITKEIVIDNTIKIANQISNDIKPIVTGVTPPFIAGADKTLREETIANAEKMYGTPLNEKIKERLNTELDFIIKGGYAVHYLTALNVVKESEKLGYLVGSRGSVGSSAVAFMVGITEVNALAPHYRSKYGDYFEWGDASKYQDGFDLPIKEDPNHPGENLIRDGHNIPFSTFLGLKGTKVPDIDLNTSPEVQSTLQVSLKKQFGEDHTIRVGTISGLAHKSAYGYVKKYTETRNEPLAPGPFAYITNQLENIKKTTGQHPAGIMIVPKDKEIIDYTPYNYPSNKPGIWKTTHYPASDMHDALLKMDILGHDDPSMLHMLQQTTGVNPKTIDVTDPKIMNLFKTGNVSGIPEFNTQFAKGVLKIAQPKTFFDLAQISGLSHGTNVWEGNAKELIEKQGKTLSDIIGSRDKIVTDLLDHGIDIEIADKISGVVKKGKPLTKDIVEAMTTHGVPDWYIGSLRKISYLFPAAHAVAYVMSALRIAYYKVYYPIQFYNAVLTYRYDEFEVDILTKNSLDFLEKQFKFHQMKLNETKVKTEKNKEKKFVSLYKLLIEANKAGVVFDKPSLYKSDISKWLIDKNTNHIIIPLYAIKGFGSGAAEKVIDYRNAHDGKLPTDMETFKSKDGIGINKTVRNKLEKLNLIKVHSHTEDVFVRTLKNGTDKYKTVTTETIEYL